MKSLNRELKNLNRELKNLNRELKNLTHIKETSISNILRFQTFWLPSENKNIESYFNSQSPCFSIIFIN